MKMTRLQLLVPGSASGFDRRWPRLTAMALLALGMVSARAALAQDPASANAAPAAAPPPAQIPPTPPAATPAAALPAAALPPTEDNKPARTAGAGLGLSPSTPQIGAGAMITAGEAESLTPTVTTGGSDEWKFQFHGYMRGPMRFSWGPPTPRVPDPNAGPGFMPSDAPPGTQLHGKPRVPGASYIAWEYTNTVPDPWAQLNFSFGNSRAMMTVIVDSYGQTSAGYRNLQSQQGIDQAWVTLNFPEAFGDRGGLVLNVGAFQNRYGTAGKYDAGMYETYLFGRTHVGGETLTANIDTGSEWGLTIEHGIGTKLEVIPFTNNQLFQIFKGAAVGTAQAANQGFAYPRNLSDRDAEYLPYAGPIPQGSTFLTHGHVGLAYKKAVTLGAHVLYSWSPDDNWDATNSNIVNVSDATPRATGPSPGSMLVWGADVRLALGAFGDGYAGYSHVDAKNINVLADALEVLHSFGGWQFKQNFFGTTFNPHTGSFAGPQNESGTVDTIEFQYAFSFGAMARYPAAFWGDGPDLVATAFGMLSIVDSPSAMAVGGAANPMWDMSTKKLKLGADIMYTPLPWFGIGGRFDNVQPDLDAKMGGSTLNFSVFSPRAVIRTAFVTHEAVTIMYQHYFLGSAAYPIYPYQWVPKADADLISVAGTMWW